jgi:hypothetical protein
MKNQFFVPVQRMFFLSFLFILSGCLKDSAKQTYTVTRPILAKLSDVRASIKIEGPSTVSSPGKMYLYGNTIFLNESGKGIHIIDNSNPATPVNKSFLPIPGNYDMAVKGNMLYADCFTDLLAIDISNPNQIVLKSFISQVFPDKQFQKGFYIDSGYCTIGWNTKDTSINPDFGTDQMIWLSGGMAFLSSSSRPQSFASSDKSGSNGQAGSMAKMAIQNGWLYAVSNSFLQVVDLSQADKPLLSKTIQTSALNETVFPFKDKLFIGSQTGMSIYSVSNPNLPVYQSMFSHARVCDPVIADDTHAYVTLRSNGFTCMGNLNEMNVLDIRNIQNPILLKTYPFAHPKGLSKEGNTLMVCDGEIGVKIYDASNPENLKHLQNLALEDAYDVICYNNIAYISAKGGLYQFNFSKPDQTKLISKISISND